MTIENSVYQILTNIPEIASDIGDKVYFETNPNREDTEYLIYQKIYHSRPLSVSLSDDIEEAGFQLDIYSQSEDKARNIRDHLVNNLHGQSNTLYSNNIQLMLIDSDSSGSTTDPLTYRITISLTINF